MSLDNGGHENDQVCRMWKSHGELLHNISSDVVLINAKLSRLENLTEHTRSIAGTLKALQHDGSRLIDAITSQRRLAIIAFLICAVLGCVAVVVEVSSRNHANVAIETALGSAAIKHYTNDK